MRVANAAVRWGIAGFGWVARDYAAPAIAASGNGALAAVCDPSPEARVAAAALGARAYASLPELLAAGGIDALYVATPNHLHSSTVEAAARAGLDVLCEKPMATSHADALAMAAAARAHGIVYATAYDQRFHPAHERVRAAVRDGALGTVTTVRIVYACWVDRAWASDNWRVDAARSGGGALVDLAPHALDLIAFVLDEPLVHATALGQRRVHDYDVDDGAVVIGRTAGGVLAQLHVAYNVAERLPRRRLEVIGTRGQLVALDTMGQTAGGTLTLTEARTGASVPLPYPDATRTPFTGMLAAFAARSRVFRERDDACEGANLASDVALMAMLEGLQADVERSLTPAPAPAPAPALTGAAC